MPESLYPQQEQADEALAWGCVFCMTGAEHMVEEQLAQLEGVARAFAVRQVQHRSHEGKRTEVIKVMMPGYVFFAADRGFDRSQLYRWSDSIIKLLTYEGSWVLRGDDLAFARWMDSHGGLLELSQARKVGDRVTILSGPLKELEGVIQKVDRHNRNGLVHVMFGGKQIKVWLAFELITEEHP